MKHQQQPGGVAAKIETKELAILASSHLKHLNLVASTQVISVAHLKVVFFWQDYAEIFRSDVEVLWLAFNVHGERRGGDKKPSS